MQCEVCMGVLSRKPRTRWINGAVVTSAGQFAVGVSGKCHGTNRGILRRDRTAYEKDWVSATVATQQMAVALYFIDVLALRAGHEKEEDEADTVGCCTLKANPYALP